jgi:hypothetical protein
MEYATRIAERDDILTPHKCDAAYILSDFGTDLDAIEPFTVELTEIVDKMKEELVNETKILEGTVDPVYTIDQNELSGSESKEDQWKTDSPSGSWKIDRILISPEDSNISSVIAEHLNQHIPTLGLNEKCIRLRTNSCVEKSDVCGCATETTSESCECTVPMTSEQTPGTPNEVK